MKTCKVIFLSALVAAVLVMGASRTPSQSPNRFMLPTGYCAQCLEQMKSA